MKSLFFNAQVYAGGKVSRRSFLVENGRFTAVGPDAEILRLAGSDTDRINLHGLFVCPGFNDSHMHLISLGQSLRTAQLSGHTGSLAGMLAYLRQFAAGHPPRNGQGLRALLRREFPGAGDRRHHRIDAFSRRRLHRARKR